MLRIREGEMGSASPSGDEWSRREGGLSAEVRRALYSRCWASARRRAFRARYSGVGLGGWGAGG